MDNAWGEKLFLSSTHNKKLLLHLVFLCLAIHGILNKEDGVSIEQKLLGIYMGNRKSGLWIVKSQTEVTSGVKDQKARYATDHFQWDVQTSSFFGYVSVSGDMFCCQSVHCKSGALWSFIVLVPVQRRVNFGSGYIHLEQAAACLIHRRIPVAFMEVCHDLGHVNLVQ